MDDLKIEEVKVIAALCANKAIICATSLEKITDDMVNKKINDNEYDRQWSVVDGVNWELKAMYEQLLRIL